MSNFDVNEFFKELSDSQPVVYSAKKETARRWYLTIDDNAGAMTGILIPDSNGRTYKSMLDCKKVKLKNKGYDNESWYWILPKEHYGQLNEEESSLYDKVASLFNSNREKGIGGDRLKTQHINLLNIYNFNFDRTNQKKHELNNSPVQLVITSKSFPRVLKDRLEIKTKNYGGRRDWINNYFSDLEERKYFVTISATKATNGIGWDINISFEKDDEDFPIIPNGFKVTPELKEVFSGDIVKNFLGRSQASNIEGKIFDKEVYQYMLEQLLAMGMTKAEGNEEDMVNNNLDSLDPTLNNVGDPYEEENQ